MMKLTLELRTRRQWETVLMLEAQSGQSSCQLSQPANIITCHRVRASESEDLLDQIQGRIITSRVLRTILGMLQRKKMMTMVMNILIMPWSRFCRRIECRFVQVELRMIFV